MKNQSLFAFLALLLLSAGSALGQIPDATCWTGDPNPDGSQVVPAIWYDPSSGVLSVNTLGLNQALDTSDLMAIGGDDVGMISLSVEGPDAEFLLTGFVNGVVWNAQNFNGKAQMFGVPAGSQFLEPSARTDVFQYPTGLTSADFGSAQMAINYADGQPGGIIFGEFGVFCVPEPSAIFMLVVGCLLTVRRRS